MQTKNIYLALIPIMICFLVMGFVDVVGIATNYVKADFGLSDTMANLLPSMVFVWFLVFSVPTSMLMNRIGRKNTVVISIFVTMLALILAVVDYTFVTIMISFALLGIGNTLLQVSLNPLVKNVISGDKYASALTFGQFVKAIVAFSAPIIAVWGVTRFDNWRAIFLIFLAVAVIALVYLWLTPIKEEKYMGKTSSFTDCFSLLTNSFILLSFVGIMCHVGLDVGISTTAPRLLTERLGMDLGGGAGYATSVYFLFRTLGCFAGTFILARWSAKKFFTLSVGMMLVALIGLLFVDTLNALYVCIAFIGFGNSNMFPIMFSQATSHMPTKENEVSGLMIMGLIGGAIFPLFMGIFSDAMMSQTGAVIVMLICVLYLLGFATKIRTKTV